MLDIAAAISAAAAAGLATLLVSWRFTAIRRRVTQRWRGWDWRLRRYSGNELTAPTLFTILVVLALVVWLVLNPVIGPWAGLLSAGVLYVGPDFWAKRLEAKFRQRFQEMLPATLQQLASSARAGRSLLQCLEDGARDGPDPVAGELDQVVREAALRGDLAEALEASRRRLKLRTYDLAVTTLLVNREKGGPLPRTLETIGDALKELLRLEEKVQTSSSEARKSAQVIAFMPLLIVLIVFLMEPEILNIATSSWVGVVMMVASFLMFSVGMVWMMRISRIDV